jgi:hypothetical protein
VRFESGEYDSGLDSMLGGLNQKVNKWWLGFFFWGHLGSSTMTNSKGTHRGHPHKCKHIVVLKEGPSCEDRGCTNEVHNKGLSKVLLN